MVDNKTLIDEKSDNENCRRVNTGWTQCKNYVQVDNKEIGMRICGNCRYCNKFDSGKGFAAGESADCYYPTMVQ